MNSHSSPSQFVSENPNKEIPMAVQTYANHRRYDFMFHVVLFLLLLLTLGGSLVNLYKSIGDEKRIYCASLIFVLTSGVFLLAFFCRIYALKAQDRAIRAEENLRHYVLCGKLLDPRLSIQQVIGLRFAPDEEFPELAQKAADQNLSQDAIKRVIKNWKPDTYRV
jgi:hypothetical protein